MSAFRLRDFSWDIGLLLVLSGAALATCAYAHEAVKGTTHLLAIGAPCVFTVAVISLVPLSARQTVWKRILVNLLGWSVAIPLMLVKGESLYAPFAWRHGATVSDVEQWIASNDDLSRFKAWARIESLTKDERDALAKQLVHDVTGPNEAASHSAAMTLDLPLRQHMIAALTELAPTIDGYLQDPANADERTQRSAAFARHFVRNNPAAIKRALGEKNRNDVQDQGVAVLVLAMALDDEIGQKQLQEIALKGDDALKEIVRATLGRLPHAKL